MRKFILIIGLSLFLSLGLIALIGPQLLQEDTVLAAEYPSPCIPILGVTDVVDKGTEDDPGELVGNGGAMFFNSGIELPGIGQSVPNEAVRACVVDLGPQVLDTDVRYIFDGWVVDSNLGWINFNCKTGTGRGGTVCSDSGIDYRVEITQEGTVQGFAYSDIAGWIGFTCSSGSIRMDGSDYACGAFNYRVLVDTDSANAESPPPDMQNGKMYYSIFSANNRSHAFSDRLGWFRMFGMSVPFGDFVGGFEDGTENGDAFECSDGIDNDFDGRTDFDGSPSDPHCFSLTDDSEAGTQCSDNIDNDGDGLKDFDGAGGDVDPGCSSFEDDDESDPVIPPECNDGIDNDGDGYIDFPEPGCFAAFDNSEVDTECTDWLDNDGDGYTDYAGYGGDLADPQCEGNPNDDDESGVFVGECADGLDNNGNGLADYAGVDRSDPPDGDVVDVEDYAADPGCINPGDQIEGDVPACADTFDNDGDLLSDFGFDPGCVSFEDDDEDDLAGGMVATDDLGLDGETEGHFSGTGDPECSDIKDNDGDGKADFPGDSGCYSSGDDSEIDTQCNDDIDNDGDGLVDYLGGSGGEDRDYNCDSFEDDSEGAPACNDGLDNDMDGKIDYQDFDVYGDGSLIIPADPECGGDPNGETEYGTECSEDPDLLNLADPLQFQNCFLFPQEGNWLSIYPNPYTDPIIADGKRGYNIMLHLADVDGTPYDDDIKYTFDPDILLANIVEADWKYERFEDDGMTSGQDIADLAAEGLVTEFNFIDVQDGISVYTWIANVRSPVPTEGSPEIFYVVPKSLDGKVPLPDGDIVPVPKNTFTVPKLNISVTEGGSEVLYVELVAKENPIGVDDAQLRFNPIAWITELLSDGRSFINGIRDVENLVTLEVEYKGILDGVPAQNTPVTADDISIGFILSPYDIFDASDPLTFLYDWINYPSNYSFIFEQDDPTGSADSEYKIDFDELLGQTSEFTIKPLLGAEEEPEEYVGRPSWVSYIEYNLPGYGNVSYYVKSMPSTEVQGVFNPSIDVIGLIYSRVITNPQDTDRYFSTGNLTSNVLRDTVTANLATILGNTVPADASANMIVSYDNASNQCDVELPTGAIAVDVGDSVLYYIDDGDIIFEAGSNDIDCSGENAAFVTVDGNVFIDNNISGGVGIIALRKGVGINTFVNGHAYIRNDVSDIYANFVLDGTMWGAYDGTKGASYFESDGRIKNQLSDDDLKMQLAIFGSITSNNTIGGSVEGAHAAKGVPADTYLDCYGKFVTDQDLARVCDLNYARRFRLYLERITSSDGSLTIVVDQQCKEDEGITDVAQLTAHQEGNPPSCYDIDQESSYANGGDLIDQDPSDGSSLRSKSLQSTPVDAPFVIRFKTSTHPVFKARRSTDFGRPNY